MYYYALIDTVYNDTNNYCIFILLRLTLAVPPQKHRETTVSCSTP